MLVDSSLDERQSIAGGISNMPDIVDLHSDSYLDIKPSYCLWGKLAKEDSLLISYSD